MSPREERGATCVPKEFVLRGPNQCIRREMKVFASSQEESMFTQTVEKLGFSITALAKGGGWGINLEAGMDKTTHTESKEIQQHILYTLLFLLNQVHLYPTGLLHLSHWPAPTFQCCSPGFKRHWRPFWVSQKTQTNCSCWGIGLKPSSRGLGLMLIRVLCTWGIYWWKAISEGFQKEQLAEVNSKQQRPWIFT